MNGPFKTIAKSQEYALIGEAVQKRKETSLFFSVLPGNQTQGFTYVRQGLRPLAIAGLPCF
jgi:hypothetical protein